MPKRSHDTDDSEATGQEIIPKKMFNCGEIVAQTKLLPFASKYQFIDKRYRFKKRWINGCQCMDFPLSQNIYEQPCGYGRLIPKPNPPVPSNEFAPVKVSRM
ncbi:unnamed protein product [Anisakis simplex]|uniref:Uncharacterized protein n=1 Tax=Anisakis simplex TaxID=6269 RepID=A0A0M3KEW8_ANISI|nr:unnamed protein product [Anisakis simplex]